MDDYNDKNSSVSMLLEIVNDINANANFAARYIDDSSKLENILDCLCEIFDLAEQLQSSANQVWDCIYYEN